MAAALDDDVLEGAYKAPGRDRLADTVRRVKIVDAVPMGDLDDGAKGIAVR
jgi:hypothetical protein